MPEAAKVPDSNVTDQDKQEFAHKMIHLYHRGMMNSGWLGLGFAALTGMWFSNGHYIFGAMGIVSSFFCAKDAVEFYNYRKIAKEVYGG